METKIYELLNRCGLTSTEQSIIIDLFSYGTSTAGQIAKRIGAKRPTVYAALSGLNQRKLVSSFQKNSSLAFSMVSLTEVSAVLKESALNHFQMIEEATSELEEYLKKMPQKRSLREAGFQILSLDSVEAVYARLSATLRSGEYSSFFNPQLGFVGRSEKVVTQFLKITKKTKPNIREIIIPGRRADLYLKQIKNPNHEVKIFPDANPFTSDLIFHQDSVLITHYGSTRERILHVSQRELYLSMLSIFNGMWKRL